MDGFVHFVHLRVGDKDSIDALSHGHAYESSSAIDGHLHPIQEAGLFCLFFAAELHESEPLVVGWIATQAHFHDTSNVVEKRGHQRFVHGAWDVSHVHRASAHRPDCPGRRRMPHPSLGPYEELSPLPASLFARQREAVDVASDEGACVGPNRRCNVSTGRTGGWKAHQARVSSASTRRWNDQTKHAQIRQHLQGRWSKIRSNSRGGKLQRRGSLSMEKREQATRLCGEEIGRSFAKGRRHRWPRRKPAAQCTLRPRNRKS
mmetsp:Transcript_7076/g.43598  ORF Transcript_7076/g.43598 Transcript_7076/m.43598 type:complete len:261 (-) Transcript_7076:2147-2929(-)